MGLLDGLMGNASEVDLQEVEDELKMIVIEGEELQAAYKIIRDMLVFTDKRLILIDKQGLSGKKVEYLSVPYSKITHFSVETAGTFDVDAELKIWISSAKEPVSKQFKKDDNIYKVQKKLANYVL